MSRHAGSTVVNAGSLNRHAGSTTVHAGSMNRHPSSTPVDAGSMNNHAGSMIFMTGVHHAGLLIDRAGWEQDHAGSRKDNADWANDFDFFQGWIAQKTYQKCLLMTLSP